MNSSNPIVVGEKSYDKLSVNLAVTSAYNSNGERDMSIALRVIPTCITPEGTLTLDSQAYTVYRGRLSELKNSEEQSCVQKMTTALAEFITSQGW